MSIFFAKVYFFLLTHLEPNFQFFVVVVEAIIIGNRFGQEIEVPSTSSVSKDIIVIPTGISSSDVSAHFLM